MAKIILTEAAQNGIQNTTKLEMNNSAEYKKLVGEANKQIDENRHRYATAYKKSATYLAR